MQCFIFSVGTFSFSSEKKPIQVLSCHVIMVETLIGILEMKESCYHRRIESLYNSQINILERNAHYQMTSAFLSPPFGKSNMRSFCC